jgi:cytochrome c-type biogenesis protein CcsB
VYFAIFSSALNLIFFSLVFVAKRNEKKIARIAMSLTWLTGGFLIAALTLRGIAANRAPWGNMYEFALASATAIILSFLIISLKKDIEWLGIFIIVPVILLLGVAVNVLYTESGPLVPALKSTWLIIHVSTAIISYGAFSLNFGLSIIYLLKVKNKLKKLPSAKKIDEFSYKVVLFAFPIWTFAVISGAIWAESAWGRYWGWDPKETWAFITWIIYAAYLHSRVTVGWKGTKSAWLSIAGYVAIVFNFFVINIWVTGLHSYAGV